MILMWATSISRGIGRGGALKIKTFLDPEMATSKASAIWAITQLATSLSTRLASRKKHKNIFFSQHKHLLPDSE